MAAPLKLKRQKSVSKNPPEQIVSKTLGFADVLVDAPVSHLEGIYEYHVPQSLNETAVGGTKVIVPFGNTRAEGLILLRKEKSQQVKNLKTIIELSSPSGVISPDVLTHLEAVRNRFGGSYWNLLKSAIPNRVVREERNISVDQPEDSVKGFQSDFLCDLIGRADLGLLTSKLRIRWAINLPVGVDRSLFVSELIRSRAQVGQVLVIVPDEKDISELKARLSGVYPNEILELGTHLTKAHRYRNFLKTTIATPNIIIGTRSAAFARLAENSTVIVLSDLDNSHYEQHSPGWNSRDVSLLRGKDVSLLFISASHSIEVSRLIEIGWLERKIYRTKIQLKVHSHDNARSYIPTIRKSFETGNVLVIVAEKGYANLFLCAKCRNTAQCACGGKLQILRANTSPVCYLCQISRNDWKCDYCGDSRPFVIAKGIDRSAEEIGRAIPKASILISSGSKQLFELPKGHHVVLATAGSEPMGTYTGVVLLDCEKIFNRPSLRSEEIAKFQWFSAVCRSLQNPEIFISLPNNHPVVQSFLKGDSYSGVANELLNRERAKLPPYFRVAVVSGVHLEISKFAENLRSTKKYEITGPVQGEAGQSKLIIRALLAEANELVDLLDDVTKLQGVKGKKIFKVRFDPYDL